MDAPLVQTCRHVWLTAPGPGALAVVRLFGPDALSLADRVFRPSRQPERPLSATPPRRPRLGRLGTFRSPTPTTPTGLTDNSDTHNHNHNRVEVGDEVVAIRFDDDPRQPPQVEFQGHGGLAARQAVEAILEAAGSRPVPARVWRIETQGLTTIQADAYDDLAYAPTRRTAAILLDQALGALDRDLDSLERLEADDPACAADLRATLSQRFEVGSRLISGWNVALAGRPNVGKSSLMNALAGHARAIVSPQAGTTRDVLTVPLACDGWPMTLFDTAGLRDQPSDDLEAQGILRARNAQTQADLVLLLLDSSQPLEPLDLALLHTYPNALLVATKADLAPRWRAEDLPTTRKLVSLSALTGEGLDRLLDRLAQRLVPNPPPAGSAVPFRVDHLTRLNRTNRAKLSR